MAVTEQLSLFGGDGEGRDVVQPRAKRENRPRQLARLSGIVQKVQRNRLIEGERAGLGSPEHGNMADRAEGVRDVSGEAADVGAFGDGGGEGDFVSSP